MSPINLYPSIHTTTTSAPGPLSTVEPCTSRSLSNIVGKGGGVVVRLGDVYEIMWSVVEYVS